MWWPRSQTRTFRFPFCKSLSVLFKTHATWAEDPALVQHNLPNSYFPPKSGDKRTLATILFRLIEIIFFLKGDGQTLIVSVHGQENVNVTFGDIHIQLYVFNVADKWNRTNVATLTPDNLNPKHGKMIKNWGMVGIVQW